MSDQRESHLRSILKGLTWRLVATGTTIFIAWVVTGKISDSLAIGGGEFLTKLLLYYLHERIWQLAPRGTIRQLSRLFRRK